MLVARAVVAHRGVGHGLLALREGDRHGIRPVGPGRDGVLGDPGGRLEEGERPACVAAGEPHEVLAGVVVERVGAVEAARVGHRRPQHVVDVVVGERLQGDQHRAGQQRGDDRERRVLGRGRDEHDLAVLDPGQQGVLLGLGEPVDLVEEEHGLAAVHVAGPVGVLHHRAHVLDPGGDRRQLDELAVGRGRDEVGQGGLAGARRPPQDRRDRAGRSPAALDEPAQRAARAAARRPGRAPRRCCAAASAPPAAAAMPSPPPPASPSAAAAPNRSGSSRLTPARLSRGADPAGQ